MVRTTVLARTAALARIIGTATARAGTSVAALPVTGVVARPGSRRPFTALGPAAARPPSAGAGFAVFL